MDSFLDTNIPLAYVFSIEPMNTIAEKIFQHYDKTFWSDNVRIEFNHRFNQKQTTLSSFFNELHYNVEKSHNTYFTRHDIMQFAYDHDYDSEKQQKDIIQATKNFWNIYFPYNRRPEKMELETTLREFLMDLNSRTYQKVNNIPKLFHHEIVRKKDYPQIFAKFKKFKMGKCDKKIVIDAHDFGINHPIDFITFDEGCKEGASIDGLSFNNVLGRFDF